MNLRVLLGMVAAFCCASAMALSSDNKVVIPENAFPIPDKYNLVNDYINVLSIAKRVEITKKLQALEKHNGTQIVFLSIDSSGKEGNFEYGLKVARKWDIGNNGDGNGALFLCSANAPCVILTGAGIAGALPDVKLARIFREILDPQFKQGKHAEAIEAALDEMIKAARGEDTNPTFYNYFAVDGSYYSPWLTFYERLKMRLTTEQILIAVLMLVGLLYAATLLWLRRRGRKASA